MLTSDNLFDAAKEVLGIERINEINKMNILAVSTLYATGMSDPLVTRYERTDSDNDDDNGNHEGEDDEENIAANGIEEATNEIGNGNTNTVAAAPNTVTTARSSNNRSLDSSNDGEEAEEEV